MASSFRFLVLIALAAALVVALRPRLAPSQAHLGPGVAQDAADAGEGSRVVLDPGACASAGYLCAGLRSRETARVLRWSDGTPVLRVRVPLPSEDAEGRALQRAAERGVRAWHGRPFPIRILRNGEAGPADVTVAWRASLNGSELGHVVTRWTRRGDDVSVVVESFLLATHDPLRAGRRLDPRDIELAAAHEMGHALGLPHSDSPDDVMYPTNEATRLSADDLRTVEALYRLPNGALVAPSPEG